MKQIISIKLFILFICFYTSSSLANKLNLDLNNAEERFSEFVLSCSSNGISEYAKLSTLQHTKSQLAIGKQLDTSAGIFSVDHLIKHSKEEDQFGNHSRTGSKTQQLNCGRITMRIHAGFLNSNPNGHEGIWIFPVIEIGLDGKDFHPPITLGTCWANSDRFNMTSKCPDAWAVNIQVSAEKNESTPSILMNHQFKSMH